MRAIGHGELGAGLQPRIFLGPIEIAGYFSRLKHGFDRLGVAATYGILRPHPFGYGVAEAGLAWPVRWCRATHSRRMAARTSIGRACWTGTFAAASAIAFAWALARHDVFIFGFGTSFFALAELPVLRFFGKRIAFVFFGSDARPVYLDGALLEAEPGLREDSSALAARARRQRTRVARIEKYADALVNNPPTGCLHARPFAIWLRMGVPTHVPATPPAPPDPGRGTVRLLHAPSAPQVKGTDQIRAAIERLKARGLPLELVEIAGQSNERVQQELDLCDFVVDQVYSDTPMATLAAEAACHGRPAVVAGYYSRGIAADLRPEDIPPSIYCHPDDLEEAIARLASNPAERLELGRRAYEFVAARFHPETVAGRYLQLLRGELPPEFIYDPLKQLRTVVPVGMDEAAARSLMQRILRAEGRSAFQVGHNPPLEQMMARFAEESGSC